MKRLLIIALIVLLIFPTVLAIDVDVKKVSEGEVMIVGVDKPAIFKLNVTNNLGATQLEFYNLLGFSMSPFEKISFDALETKEIEVRIRPLGEFDHIGPYSMKYFIKDSNGSQVSKTLTFKRIELADALEVGATSFNPDSNSIEIYVKNLENIELDDCKATFSSSFFDVEENFDLAPYEEKTFSIDLNKDDFEELIAGFYTMATSIEVEDASASFNSNLEFKEKSDVKTEVNDYGFFVRTKVINKENAGNVASNEKISVEKNILSRLFTSFEPDPDVTNRDGGTVSYIWSKTLNPGDSFEVTVKTNWIFPILLLLMVIVIVALAKQYASTNLILEKKVTFVKAKGGEFALKITIYARAKKYIERVNIIERLPALVKIYEKFGTNHPSRVDEKAKRIEWNFPKLEAGEIRVMSYIIYSKVGVMGKFSLPAAKGIFERNGEINDTTSNRAFFITEPKGSDIEEE